MEVAEHFYTDDPSRGPADARTTLKDVDYFFLGNGLIQAVVQAAPAGDATPVGLLLMNPRIFTPKRGALSFDDATGLAATALVLDDGRGRHQAGPGAFRAGWARGSSVPMVEVVWRGGPYRVTEIFHCPDMRTPRLWREVRLTRTTGGASKLRLTTGVKDKSVEAAVSFRGRESRPIIFEYRLVERGGKSSVTLRPAPTAAAGPTAESYWAETATVATTDRLLDRFFAASKHQLRAAVARSGELDGSVWQYNLEWVRDQALIAMALSMSGQGDPARTILARLLREFVDANGATLDSSRSRPLEETEIDQNGLLLFALESYLRWTGDRDLILANWDKIAKTAAFPLRPEFRHPKTGLLVNRREFWERHAVHGIEPGMELAHQLFVVMGLRSAGRLAALTGHTAQAEAWTSEALALRQAMLKDPVFSSIEAGTFIKRRGLDGRVQRDIRPHPAAGLPRVMPLFRPGRHRIDPDTSSVLPIAWEFVDPAGRLAHKTLASMETLWDQRWRGGGYGRYHVSSEPDSPGPWPFASLFVARAALEAGDAATTRRVLDWLGRVPGANAASWFEFYGPRPVPPYPQVGIIPWTWAETIFLVVHHMLGVRPGPDFLSLQPKLIPGVERMTADLAVRGGRLELTVRRARRGESPAFRCGSRRTPYHRYGLGIPLPPSFDRIVVEAIIP